MNNFKFCPIDFKHRGDVSGINPEIMESIVTNLKELLTNASKYSSATKIDVSIDVNEKYIRLFVRDNGRGCSMIRTGMGLSGIKERISNIGGTVAISGDDGFTVVCLVPLAGGNVN
jgi:signal transduction histidine kinase